MKPIKNFPRNFRSSSAALRSVRQYCEKMGISVEDSGLVMTKIDAKNFLVSKPAKITFEEFAEQHPNVVYPEATFRFYPDGVKDSGYYELKTGERRRPNSIYKPIDMVYSDLVSEVCQ